MPDHIIGMIGVPPPEHGATLLIIEGAISPSFVVDFAQTHEAAGLRYGARRLHLVIGKGLPR